MDTGYRLLSRPYLKLECLFLLFLCFGLSLISDLEYSTYEEHDVRKFTESLGYRVVTDFLRLLPYGLYYWGFLKRYVFQRNLVGILLATLGFVVVYHVFNQYVINWAVAEADFVADDLQRRALRSLKRPIIGFPINYLLIAAIIPLLGLAFLVRSLTQAAQLKALTEQQLVAELGYLKAQIQPHFFFNTLNNIYALALKQSADTAPMIARLGEMMRYVLYQTTQRTVPLQGEVNFLGGFIELARIRYPPTSQIHFEVQGIRPTYQIEPLLLLPFVENAFKHGLEEEVEHGFVHVVLCQTENELVLVVQNSKSVSPKIGSSRGVGLANVHKRLDLLYPGQYQLDVLDELATYRVTLTLQTA
ncbi:sensor histidine kinase [Fibrella aquatica]|jgi:Histidine kinase|uniref:sensor histidine kinase n=1 Tax=Fibrella aquatica TaxID=3242487 RepID=UPI0035208F8C